MTKPKRKWYEWIAIIMATIANAIWGAINGGGLQL